MVRCAICKHKEPIKGTTWYVRGTAVCKKHADAYMRELLNSKWVNT